MPKNKKYTEQETNKSIAGVTGTIGDENDESILKKAYEVNLFKMPRNIVTKKPIYYRNRPQSVEKLYSMIYNEIINESSKGRPVLVILDSPNRVDELSKMFSECGKIKGLNPAEDRKSIAIAGKSKQVTIATSAAGRGMDIKLCEESLAAGGLHVIIPMPMPNKRVLEQAIGRSGRQGQPGSATVYISDNDKIMKTPEFKPAYENLMKLQNRFSEHIRQNWPWVYEYPKQYGMGDISYPFGVTEKEMLELTSKKIADLHITNASIEEKQKFCNLTQDMIMTAWGLMFNKISSNLDSYANFDDCEREYDSFLKELNVWVPKSSNTLDKQFMYFAGEILKRVDWGEVAIIGGITVTAGVISVCFPPAAPCVMIASGALMEGGTDVYKQLKK